MHISEQRASSWPSKLSFYFIDVCAFGFPLSENQGNAQGLSSCGCWLSLPHSRGVLSSPAWTQGISAHSSFHVQQCQRCCRSALLYHFSFQASEMQRDSSFHSDLWGLFLQAAPCHSPRELNSQIASVVLENMLWRFCEGLSYRKSDCRLNCRLRLWTNWKRPYQKKVSFWKKNNLVAAPAWLRGLWWLSNCFIP